MNPYHPSLQNVIRQVSEVLLNQLNRLFLLQGNGHTYDGLPSFNKSIIIIFKTLPAQSESTR